MISLSALYFVTLIQLRVGFNSICVTTVFTGSTKLGFSTESIDNLETDLVLFCTRNSISTEDCGRIKEKHMRNCFKYENQYEAPKVMTFNTYEKPVTNTHKTLFGKVDYSQKIGPAMKVYNEDKTHILHLFGGETPEMGVKRFCGMVKFSVTQCNQVRTSYMKLFYEYHQKNQLIDKSNNNDVTDNTVVTKNLDTETMNKFQDLEYSMEDQNKDILDNNNNNTQQHISSNRWLVFITSIMLMLLLFRVMTWLSQPR